MILLVGVFLLTWVNAVVYSFLDPIYKHVIDPSLLQAELGVNPAETVMFFVGVGLIAMLLILVVWAIGSPLGTDIRQDQIEGPPR